MRKTQEYQRESELCDKIREVLGKIDQLDKQGRDTTEAHHQLEIVLKKLEILKTRVKIPIAVPGGESDSRCGS